MLNVAFLVAGHITVQPATLIIDKRAFVSSAKVQVLKLVLKIQENILT